MDYSKLPNPYDFANPVNDRKLFAGRQGVLEEIEYYLDHGKNASRAINLALIGERASGKTSLLNMIHLYAEQRNFSVVRLDLDESDAEYQLLFFYKLFDATITTICSQGAFNGLHGKTYDTYRDIVDTFEIPDDKTFCPFNFPMQYARAMSRGNYSVPLSDTNFKNDLTLIQSTINKPIAILIDECDVLAKSRVHLEKLRNIFMNISGFMLVFTGTAALFPLINDVFSPIIRQFKKINVEPFKNQEETQECITRPLKRIGIDNLEEILDFETYRDITEIHDLSGGKPYEIQLICHFLFKRVQQGRAKKMMLSVDVLDDVLFELQSFQDLSIRPIPTKIRSLDQKELLTLARLSSNNGRIDIKKIWFNEFIFFGTSNWTEADLENSLNHFSELGILRIDHGGMIHFIGDDFDKIYCKYYSRKHGIFISINNMPYDIRLKIDLNSAITNKLNCTKAIYTNNDGNMLDSDIQLALEQLTRGNYDENIFKLPLFLLQNIYELNMEYQGSASFPIAHVTIITPWNEKIWEWYQINRTDCPYNRCMEDFRSIIEPIKSRANELGGSIFFKIENVATIQIEKFTEMISNCRNTELISYIAFFHVQKVVEQYTDYRNIEEALKHAELAMIFSDYLDVNDCNNLGYLFLSSGNLNNAEHLFGTAIKDKKISKEVIDMLGGDTEDYLRNILALVYYNLAIVCLLRNDIKAALQNVDFCIEGLLALNLKKRDCLCLFVPKINDGNLVIQERFKPDLCVVSKEARDIIYDYHLLNSGELIPPSE